MENEHELSYETLTRVYLGSYEHYKGVVAEVEHSKPGFELQGAKMVETGQNRDFRLRTARVTTPGLRKGPLRLKVCLKSEMGHVYKLGRDVEKLVDVVYKLGSSFGEVFGIGNLGGWNTLRYSDRHPGIKTAKTRSLQEGLCQLRKLLQMPQYLGVMTLAMIGVTK
ncbi:hypothetical protein Tco_1337576 [Tanacetum coccineum]